MDGFQEREREKAEKMKESNVWDNTNWLWAGRRTKKV